MSIKKIISDKIEKKSISLFLNKKENIEYLDYVKSKIPQELLKFNLHIRELIYYYKNNIKEPILCNCGNPNYFNLNTYTYDGSCLNEKCLIDFKKSNIGSLSLFLSKEKNKKYLDYLKSNTIDLDSYNLTIPEYIYYYFNNIEEPFLCICDKHRKFTTFKEGFKVSCGDKKCFMQIKKDNFLSNHGVDNPRKLKSVVYKARETINKKYNGKHYMYDPKVRSKFNNTMRKEYGVDWAQQNIEINNKSRDKWNLKSDKDLEDICDKKLLTYSLKSDEEKLMTFIKREKTNIERYGEDYRYIFSENVRTKHLNRITKLISEDYNCLSFDIPNEKYKLYHKDCCEFYIGRYVFRERISLGRELCTTCNPVTQGVSELEKDIFNFIDCNYTETIVQSNRSIIPPLELDIYLPNDNLAFEFNGLYWHSDLYKENNYHLNKTEKCESKGVQLIHIYEDDWLYKQEIVKSRILNLLSKSERIYARKCIVKEVTPKDTREFLNKNHIQGFVGSKIKLGLYHNDTLVSLMTFGSLRRNLGQTSKDGSFELLRFCNILNTTVIGGASKLFKYFTRNYDFNTIISYADRSWSTGNIYEQLGFKYVHKTKPNYYYVKNDIRLNRFGFRKDILVKEGFDQKLSERIIMKERGFNRLYDSGSIKFVYK
jgi:hypothetical protein